jgi:hypothetical protein
MPNSRVIPGARHIFGVGDKTVGMVSFFKDLESGDLGTQSLLVKSRKQKSFVHLLLFFTGSKLFNHQ